MGSALRLLMLATGLLLASVGAAQPADSGDLSPTERSLVDAFLESYRSATAIPRIPPDSLTESQAYRIADAYVEILERTEGPVAGYKIGTFAAGQYDDGPVDGFSGPVTAVMFAGGLHADGHQVDINCCNFSFVEADFAAEVRDASINEAQSELEILAALRGFRPFIEMPDILRTTPDSSRYSGIATNYDFRNGIAGELIPIPATPAGLERLRSFSYTMTNESGAVLGEGDIADAYDPVYRVRALRDRLLQRGRVLKAGDLLSLGNMGTIRPLKPGVYMLERPRFEGSTATVTYYGLGDNGPSRVRVNLDR